MTGTTSKDHQDYFLLFKGVTFPQNQEFQNLFKVLICFIRCLIYIKLFNRFEEVLEK